MHLWELGVDLEQKDDAAGFLGVNLEQESKTGLIEEKKLYWFSVLFKLYDWTMVW